MEESPGNILYWMFVPRCQSNKCSRKIRVKFMDEHVISAAPVVDEEGNPEGFSMSYIEGKGIRELTEEDPHAIEEFGVVAKLVNQYLGWLHGKKEFEGVDHY